MYEYSRSILNDDYKGVSNLLFDKARKYNTVWGPDFYIFTSLCMNEEETEDKIDRIMFIKAFGE